MLIVSSSAVFANPQADPDSEGWQLMNQAASNAGIVLTDDELLSGDLYDNVWNELISKNPQYYEETHRYPSPKTPYLFYPKTAGECTFYPDRYMMCPEQDFLRSSQNFENGDHISKPDYRAQNIYSNSNISSTFAYVNSPYDYEGKKADSDSLGKVFGFILGTKGIDTSDDTYQEASEVGTQLGSSVSHSLVNPKIERVQETRSLDLYINTPYLSMGGTLADLRKKNLNPENVDYYGSVGPSSRTKTRFAYLADAIANKTGNKVSLSGYEIPSISINGKRLAAYDDASFDRKDVDNADRVLYVYGKIAQAMVNGTWNRSLAVMKRESELFTENPDNNYVYLCVPLKEQIKERYMTIDKFYIPKSYENAKTEDTPIGIQQEKAKLDSLLQNM